TRSPVHYLPFSTPPATHSTLFPYTTLFRSAIIGAFLIQLIRNGSVLLDINIYVQDVIIGVVVWLAVAWDQFRRKKITDRGRVQRSEEHTSELQSRFDLVCRPLLEKIKNHTT